MVVAARVGVAPGRVALDTFEAILGGAVLRAFVVRANRFAALVFIALVVLALDLLGIVDQGVPVGALDRVAAFDFRMEMGTTKDAVRKTRT